MFVCLFFFSGTHKGFVFLLVFLFAVSYGCLFLLLKIAFFSFLRLVFFSFGGLLFLFGSLLFLYSCIPGIRLEAWFSCGGLCFFVEEYFSSGGSVFLRIPVLL